MPPGMLVFCLYHTPDSAEFWAQLEDGMRMTPGSPVLILRNRLIEDRTQKSRLREDERLALVIKAHNAWITGKTPRHLRWRTAGDKAEQFPRWVKR
jgi:hypothetical protein